MQPSRTFHIETFGCKVNRYDSQMMREALQSLGWRETGGIDDARVAIVDTCTVTENAARETLRRIRRLAREPRGRVVVVTGCLVASHRAVLESIPGIGLLLPTEAKGRLGEALADLRIATTPTWLPGDPAGSFRLGISRFEGRSRAFVKVQDGCNHGCAYCIVPTVRGRSRSRPLPDAVSEVRRLVASGYRELVLTGVHLGAYGRDLPGRPRLSELVDRVLAVPGAWRLRLSSIEANELRPEDVETIAAFCVRTRGGSRPRLCPHLHLPLQSGSPDVLRRMRRPSSLAAFERTVASLRDRIPDLAVTTDLIVGFPGETDADFEATRDAACRLAFSRIHAFPFSPRPGTPAAFLKDPVPADIVRRRMRALTATARATAAAFHRRFIGRTVEVLVENRPDRSTGRPAGYSGRYVRVRLDEPATGPLVDARVTVADATGADAVPTAARRPDPVPFTV